MIPAAALLLSALIGYGFEVLDTTDEEWVAPGYEVVEEAVIDPLEYGEPYTSNGTPTVGVHLSFVETDTGEAWRVVFVLERKVVVLEEGEEPVEIAVDLDMASCAFSPSGRYVVVHDGARTYTGENAARIDTQSGDVRTFDSQPEGEPGPRGIEVSDSGILRCGLRFYGENLAATGDLNDPNVRWNRGTLSPSGRYFAVEKAWRSPSLISLFSTDGELLWENNAQSLAFASLVGDIVFSPDERFLAVPLQTGLEVWDVATGDVVWRDESSRIPGWDLTFSEDGRGLACTVPGLSSAASMQVLLDEGDFSDVIPVPVSGSRYSNIRIAAAPCGRRVLVQMARGVPDVTRRFSILADGSVTLWASGEYDIPWGPLTETPILFQVDVASKIAALSDSGTRAIWIDANLVHVAKLQEQS